MTLLKFELHPRQSAAFTAIEATEILYGGSAGSGKALALDTPVLCPGGFRPIADLVPGDLVYNRFGNAVPIVAISPIMHGRPCYRVEFSDGAAIVADESHLWITLTEKERMANARRTEEFRSRRRQTRKRRGTGKRPDLVEANENKKHSYLSRMDYSERTTLQILQTLYLRGGRVNHSVPICAPINPPLKQNLIIKPYTLGAWLGDGNSDGCGFTTNDPEILEHIKADGYSVRKRAAKYAHGIQTLTSKLRALNVIKNKHIPKEYLQASFDERLSLLQGLMDTDGYCTKSGDCEFDNTNGALARDVLFLVRSLGIKATFHKGIAKLYGRSVGPKYRIAFKTDKPVFRLRRKFNRLTSIGARQTQKYIVAVESVPSVPVKCISIDCPDGCFLVGEELTVTHNSHLARVAAISWAVEIPNLQIYLFRRLYADLQLNHLEGPTGFRALLASWCNTRSPHSPLIAGRLCEIVDGEIRFWNGSKIHLCHLQHQKDVTKYYGPEFHVLMLEEATQFTEYMIRFLRSRMRIPKSLIIPDKYLKPRELWRSNDPEYYFPRALYTSNPGGVGHAAIKRMFIEQKVPGKLYQAPDSEGGHTRMYVPARVDDNPSINREQVKAGLSGLPAVLVDAMLNGNWNAVVGAYFPECDPLKHVIPPFQIPEYWPKFMSMDWGACGEGDPFAIGWWTVSDGTYMPRGSLICYRRWYGAGLPKITASQIASGIRTREQGEKIVGRWAGGDILEKRGTGPSVFEIFASEGIHFQRADMRRVTGWTQIRERLVGKNDKPLIYWTTETQEGLELLANLQHDLNNPSDVAAGIDHCLAANTIIKTKNGSFPISELVGKGGHVQNHLGEWVPFKNCKSYGVQEVIRLRFSDGTTIDCTPEHKIMNAKGEWIYACEFLDAVRYSPSWIQRLFQRLVRSLTALNTTSSDSILGAPQRNGVAAGLCTERSGSFITEKFRQITTFIISTITAPIIPFQTCSASMKLSTVSITASNQKQLSVPVKILSLQDLTQRHGIEAKRGERGIEAKTLAICAFLKTLSVRIAGSLFNHRKQNLGSVTTIANQRGEERRGLTMLKRLARFAQRSLSALSIPLLKLVAKSAGSSCLEIQRLGKQEVFCLDTPYPHSFYTANGIVVHNCPDSTRYMAQARPFIREKPASELSLEQRFKPPTMNDLWTMHEQSQKSRN